jgi:uncharacterized membrane protein YhaH (DUF805 family)
VSTKDLLWLFFGLSGRVGRAPYLLAGLLLAVIQMFLLYRFSLAPLDTPESQMWALGFWVMIAVSVLSNVALAVKRLHDFGKDGRLAILLFIPVVSIAAFLVLCVFPGDAGRNRFGEQNAPQRKPPA